MLKQLSAHLLHKDSFPASFSTLTNKSCNPCLIKSPLLVQLDFEMNNNCIDFSLQSCFMHFQPPKHVFADWHRIMGTQSVQEMAPFFFFYLIILISVEWYHSDFILQPAPRKHWFSLEALSPSKL